MAHKIETGQEKLVEVSRVPYVSGGITMPLSIAEKVIQQNPEMFIVENLKEVTLYKESARVKAEAQADLAAAGQMWEFAPPTLKERITRNQSLQPKLGENGKSEVEALLYPKSFQKSGIWFLVDTGQSILRFIQKRVTSERIPKPAHQIRNLILHGQLK